MTQSEIDRPALRRATSLDFDASKLDRAAKATKLDYCAVVRIGSYWLNFANRIEVGRVTIDGNDKPMPIRIVA